jgi:hypothetical protein
MQRWEWGIGRLLSSVTLSGPHRLIGGFIEMCISHRYSNLEKCTFQYNFGTSNFLLQAGSIRTGGEELVRVTTSAMGRCLYSSSRNTGLRMVGELLFRTGGATALLLRSPFQSEIRFVPLFRGGVHFLPRHWEFLGETGELNNGVLRTALDHHISGFSARND